MGGGAYLLTTTTRLSNNRLYSTMPPKKPKPRQAWVETTAAPAKVKVPKVTDLRDLNRLTSSDCVGDGAE